MGHIKKKFDRKEDSILKRSPLYARNSLRYRDAALKIIYEFYAKRKRNFKVECKIDKKK